MAFVTPTASRADIAITLASFLVPHRRRLAISPSLDVKLQLHRPSPSIAIHRHAVHHRQVAIAPSLSVHHHCNRSPSSSRSCCPSPYIAIKEPHPIHCHQGAVVPSIAIGPRRPSPSRSRSSLSIRLVLSSRRCSVHCCPSLLSCRRAVHRRRTAPSITVKLPLHHPLPFIAIAITVYQRCARPIPCGPSPPISRRAFHHRQVAIAPSIAVRCCPSPLLSQSITIAIAIALSLALSLSRSRHTVHPHQGAIAPSIDVPPHRPSPSSRCPLPSSVHCFQVSVAPSIAVHRRRVAVVLSIVVHHPLLLSLSCAVHCCPRRRAVAVHHPSPASVYRRRAVNCCLSSDWLLRFLSSRRRLLSTGSGVSAWHVQHLSDA